MKKIDTKKVRVKTALVVAAPDTDKQRKLLQLRKKKEQLRDKKKDAIKKFSHDLHDINGEILRVKYDNKPGLKKKKEPTAKKRTKSYVGKK